MGKSRRFRERTRRRPRRASGTALAEGTRHASRSLVACEFYTGDRRRGSNALARIACIVTLTGAVSACGAAPDDPDVQSSDAVGTPSAKATAFFGDIAIL